MDYYTWMSQKPPEVDANTWSAKFWAEQSGEVVTPERDQAVEDILALEEKQETLGQVFSPEQIAAAGQAPQEALAGVAGALSMPNVSEYMTKQPTPQAEGLTEQLGDIERQEVGRNLINAVAGPMAGMTAKNPAQKQT